jgi:hypothetical protein
MSIGRLWAVSTLPALSTLQYVTVCFALPETWTYDPEV